MLAYSLNYLTLHRSQLTKFIITGLITFVIYFLCFHFLYGLLHLGYRIAASIAYFITVVSHFMLNRLFTFKANQQLIAHNLWKYILMLGLNYINMLFIMWLVVAVTKNSPYIGIIASTGTGAIMNFFVMKHFVFGNKLAV